MEHELFGLNPPPDQELTVRRTDAEDPIEARHHPVSEQPLEEPELRLSLGPDSMIRGENPVAPTRTRRRGEIGRRLDLMRVDDSRLEPIQERAELPDRAKIPAGAD